MPGEEYIMSSKACVYVLGGETNTASLFDFDGVYVLDGGFSEKSQGFVSNVREVAAVILTSPNLGNLGTTAALLEKGHSLPVFTNTKPIKGSKPGSSGELVKAIQDANAKLLAPTSLVFDPKYPAHILYQSYSKGILSLYILAGDVKDAEVITKALTSGNEAEVEKAGSEHGTVGVLLWRPAEADKPVVRVLVSGTCGLNRIQQSLDKATKSLPFLNAANVKSKDALSAIPPPATPRPATATPISRPAGAPAKPATSRPTTSGLSRPATTTAPARALTSRAPAPAATASRTAPKPSAAPARASAKAPTAPVRAPKAPAVAKAPPAKAPVKSTAPAKAAATKAEPIAQKKTVVKVQGAAPSKAPAAPAPIKKDPPPPAATIPASATTARTPAQDVAPVAQAPPVASIVLDDMPINLDIETNSGNHQPVDIVLIPPTPEPPRHQDDDIPENTAPPKAEVDDVANLADVEDEIPQPLDAFKKPDEPEVRTHENDNEPEPRVPTPKKVEEPVPVAPTPSEGVKDSESTSTGEKEVEDKIPEPIDAFKGPEPTPEDGKKAEPTPVYPVLDDLDPLKPSYPTPSAPEVPSDHVIISTPDPNLPDIAAAVPFIPPSPLGPNDGLIKLDGDLVNIAPGFEEPLIPQAAREDGTLADCSEEISKLVEISMDTDNTTEAGAELSKAIGEVTQLSSEFQHMGLDDKTDEYVRKLSNQMIEDATLPFTSALASSIVSSNGSHESTEQKPNGQLSNGANGAKEVPKHDLMQSRSSVVESNGAPVEYEKTDPALDDILNACAQESEKLDETLKMPAAPGKSMPAKPAHFTRPYYFDVVTAPRNNKLETTACPAGLQEFMSKVRSRNVILASKDISGDQLQALILGKQTWCDSVHPCTIIPTHSSPILMDFRQRNEEQFPANHLTLSVPVEKQRTTVSSEAGATDYELAKVSLE